MKNFYNWLVNQKYYYDYQSFGHDLFVFSALLSAVLTVIGVIMHNFLFVSFFLWIFGIVTLYIITVGISIIKFIKSVVNDYRAHCARRFPKD